MRESKTNLCKLIKFVQRNYHAGTTEWECLSHQQKPKVFYKEHNWEGRIYFSMENVTHRKICGTARHNDSSSEWASGSLLKSKCLCKKVTDLSQFLIASQRSHSTSTPLRIKNTHNNIIIIIISGINRHTKKGKRNARVRKEKKALHSLFYRR